MIVREKELYHHGVKGMKWGVRKSIKRAIRQHNKNKELRAEERRKKNNREISGRTKPSLRKMNDVQKNRYAQNRIDVKGSKPKAIVSETTNFIGKTAKTVGIAAGVTAATALSGGTALAAISGSGLVSTGFNFVTGAIAGTVYGGLPSAAVAGTKTVVNGSRYVRNVVGIIGTKRNTNKS